jgi:hypothetical protein
MDRNMGGRRKRSGKYEMDKEMKEVGEGIVSLKGRKMERNDDMTRHMTCLKTITAESGEEYKVTK